jgi:hypothetical protein
MSTRRLRSALASCAIAAAAAAIASTGLVLAQGGRDPGAAIQQAASRKKAPPALNVKGSASSLYPGGTVTLPLKVRNGTRFPVTLRKLSVKVGSASRGCPGSFLVVQPFKKKARLRTRRSKKVNVRVTMSPAAPDACQGAVFPLTYRVRGVRTPAKKRR